MLYSLLDVGIFPFSIVFTIWVTACVAEGKLYLFRSFPRGSLLRWCAGGIVAVGVMFLAVTSVHRVFIRERLAAPGTAVGSVAPNSVFARAGMKSGDTIISVNGHSVSSWAEISDSLIPAPGASNLLVYRRGDGSESSIDFVDSDIGRSPGNAALWMPIQPAVESITPNWSRSVAFTWHLFETIPAALGGDGIGYPRLLQSGGTFFFIEGPVVRGGDIWLAGFLQMAIVSIVFAWSASLIFCWFSRGVGANKPAT